MPVITPIDAPPEPSSFVLMVTGLMTMGIYFLATRKKRQAAADRFSSELRSDSSSPRSNDELLQTELAIEQDLEIIQDTVKQSQITPAKENAPDEKRTTERDSVAR